MNDKVEAREKDWRARSWLRIVVITVVILATQAGARPVQAAPGDLDPTFAGFGVARFNNDGTPDTAFDEDGKTLYEFSVGPTHGGTKVYLPFAVR